MKRRVVAAAAVAVVVVVVVLLYLGLAQQESGTRTVRIAMPKNDYIQDVTTNYLKLWLEEQTGLSLAFDRPTKEHSPEYMRQLFSTSDHSIDAVFSLFSEESSSGRDLLLEFIASGFLLPLDGYIEEHGRHVNALFEQFTDYDLRLAMTAPDGHIYYMPGLDNSIAKQQLQFLWLNADWLKTLGLQVPQTTQELYEVLLAFQTGDPNGNGLSDEVPLLACNGSYAYQVTNYLLNAFVYNDPNNARMALVNEEVVFAPYTQEWREGVQYCRTLFDAGFILPDSLSFSHSQMVQMANDPRDLVGGFASESIASVLYQSAPELIGKFMHVAPLKDADGVRRATAVVPLPTPNGVILSTSRNPLDAFALMDLMLSEEASLIGRFGEAGVDWEYAQPGEISLYGGKATISVNNQLRNRIQNKHLMELGPYVAPTTYTDGVTWGGLEMEQEYVDARAAHIYRQSMPDVRLQPLIFPGENGARLAGIKDEIDAYTEMMLVRFFSGAWDPEDDVQWQLYLDGYRTRGIEELLSAAQSMQGQERAK